MEAVTSSPFLVGKIFEFLPITDLPQCRLVNKVWYDEAMRKLCRFPIDSCYLGKTIRLERFVGKPQLLRAFLLKLGQHSHPLALTEDGLKPLRSFLNEMRCCPSLTLITCDGTYFDGTISNAPIHQPAIMIKDITFTKDPMTTYQNIQLNYFMNNMRDRRKKLGLLLKALHINRFASKHKIMITRWPKRRVRQPINRSTSIDFSSALFMEYISDNLSLGDLLTESPSSEPFECNSEDLEFPTRSVIFLARGSRDPRNGFCKFESYHAFSDLLRCAQNSGANISGGALCEHSRLLMFKEKGEREWKKVRGLSIAFKGKDVKSAVFNHYIDNGNEFSKENFDIYLEAFKQNLDFPTEDGRVIGFFFNTVLATEDSKFFMETRISISEKFPAISLFYSRVEFMFNEYRGVSLHLVRI